MIKETERHFNIVEFTFYICQNMHKSFIFSGNVVVLNREWRLYRAGNIVLFINIMSYNNALSVTAYLVVISLVF